MNKEGTNIQYLGLQYLQLFQNYFQFGLEGGGEAFQILNPINSSLRKKYILKNLFQEASLSKISSGKLSI